jgi:hypothetical protein
VQSTIRTLTIAVGLALLPLAATAQQMPGGELPPEAQQLIMEMEQIHERLAPIQEQAMSDPEVQAGQEALRDEIQTTMGRIDPTLPQHIERYVALEAEFEAAQAAQDQSRMRDIILEGQQIEQRLREAEAEAIQQPQVARELDNFQILLLSKMTQIEPEAGALVDRMTELNTRLQAIVTGGS